MSAPNRNHTMALLVRVTCVNCNFEWLDRDPDFKADRCLRCGDDEFHSRPFDISATPCHGKPRLEVVT